MTLEIRTYGDSVLTRNAVPVKAVDDAIRRLAEDMIETMQANNGIGLAAPQVGRHEALCVVAVPPEADTDDSGMPINVGYPYPLVLVNPEIISASEERCTREEGCLSCPDIYAPIERPSVITVTYLDQKGVPSTLRAEGLLARCIQHEIDHLNGILITDRMGQLKRIALSGRLRRLRRGALRGVEK